MENRISLSGVLTIVFVVLKLVGVIDWSWWWVLSPTWIPIALWIAIIGVAYLAALIITLFTRGG